MLCKDSKNVDFALQIAYLLGMKHDVAEIEPSSLDIPLNAGWYYVASLNETVIVSLS